MRVLSAVQFLLLSAALLPGQGVRNHTKLRGLGTKVTQSQAEDLTLTLAQASIRPIQMWVRTAGKIDASRKILSADLSPRDAALVKVGQRVRSFSPESKSSMFQGYVTKLVSQPGGARVEVTLAAPSALESSHYVMEIVADRGQFLSIPNEAIIEEGGRRIVYTPAGANQYAPREIQTGVQGELYTQILGGLAEGNEVVTFGSFFIDAEFKLKGSGQVPEAAAAGAAK